MRPARSALRPPTSSPALARRPRLRRGARLARSPQVAALVSLLVVGWLVWSVEAPVTASNEAGKLSEQLGLWTGRTLETDARALEILETDDVALREYRLGSEPPVWLAQVAGFGNRAAFHPPELCYIGSHYEVLERGEHEVFVNGRAQRVMRLVIGQGAKRYEAWYWFTAGDRITPNYYQQQWWLVVDSVMRKPMSGKLIRISTPLDNTAGSSRRLLAFLTSFDRSMMAGASGTEHESL